MINMRAEITLPKSRYQPPSVNTAMTSPRPFCSIRGGMLPYGDCLTRLQAYWSRFEFQNPPAMAVIDTSSGDIIPAVVRRCRNFVDGIILLTGRLPYEPSWGGYGGLPRPVLLERAEFSEKMTSSHYIAPFLLSYQRACRRILLGRSADGSPTVTLPAALLPDTGAVPSGGLQVILENLVSADQDGLYTPLSVCGPYHTFPAAASLVASLARKGSPWPENRSQPIGTALSRELFSFPTPPAPPDHFGEILFPEMTRIVTDETPQLRSAEFHLQAVFSRCLTAIDHNSPSTSCATLLISALHLDMRGFGEPAMEHYLVPWQACLRQGGANGPITAQNVLLAALMAAKRPCSA